MVRTELFSMISNYLGIAELSKFSGKSVAVDGQYFLEELSSSAIQQFLNNVGTKKHINTFREKIKGLTDKNIRPFFVFDGDLLPHNRIINPRKLVGIKKYLRLYNNNIRQEEQLSTKNFDLLQAQIQIFSSYLEELENLGIEYIIAPYNVDAQLVYPEKINYVDYIMTKNSDLIYLGGKNILYDFDLEFNTVSCYNNSEFLIPHLGKFFTENILDIFILSTFYNSFLSNSMDGLEKISIALENAGTVEELFRSYNIYGTLHYDHINNLEEFYEIKNIFLYQIVYDPMLKYRVKFNLDESLGYFNLSAFKISDVQSIPRHYQPIFQSNGVEE